MAGAALLLMACGGGDAGGGLLNQWTRSSAFDPNARMAPPLESPDSAEAGKSFDVEIASVGPSSCVRADGTEVSMRGDTAEIVAYFGYRGGICTADVHRTVQRATVRFDRPGVAVIRRRGPTQVFERKIVVHPPR